MSFDRDDEARDGYDHGDPGDPYDESDNDYDYDDDDYDEVTAVESDEPDVEDLPPESWPLLDAARSFVRGTAAGDALTAKLDAFERLDDEARARIAPELRADIATVVARVITADK